MPGQAKSLIERIRSENPDVIRLATVISLAARVEPELLRKARLELLKGVDAGVEADLWFSPLVQSRNVLAFVLMPEVVETLRQELSLDQNMLKRAWEVLKYVHQDAPPAIRLEEEVTWLALSTKSSSDKIERLLLSVAVAMVTEERLGLARWAVRALPLLPSGARQSGASWVLAIGAGTRLGRKQILPQEESPKDLNWDQLRWVLPKTIQRVPVGVRLTGNGVQFGDPSMLNAHTIMVPETNPFLLEVSWWENQNRHTRLVIWTHGQTKTIQAASSSITIRTALGDVYILSPQLKTEESTAGSGFKETLIESLELALSEIINQGPPYSQYSQKPNKNLNKLERSLQSDKESASSPAYALGVQPNLDLAVVVQRERFAL